MKNTQRMISLVLATLVLFCADGCSKKNRSPKPITKQGVIKSLDKAKRTATVSIKAKMGKDVELDGQFTDETVITINGKPARIEDIQPGDSAQITVLRKGKGIDAELTATRVAIERAAGGTSRPAE